MMYHKFLIVLVICVVGTLFVGCEERVQDVNKRTTVKIGNQEWRAENLNVSTYRNGDVIPQVKDSDEWKKLTTGAWCYYDNDPDNGKNFGKLYNWYAVNDARGLAPEGWHIPTKAEFEALIETVNSDGTALKAIENGTGTGAGTNTSGFSALLSSSRDGGGSFGDLGTYTYFWSSTVEDSFVAYNLYLQANGSHINLDYSVKQCGFSVRCVKNYDQVKINISDPNTDISESNFDLTEATYKLGKTSFTINFKENTVKYALGSGFMVLEPTSDNLVFNEKDTKGTLIGEFRFEQNFDTGKYVRNKDKKEFPFSR